MKRRELYRGFRRNEARRTLKNARDGGQKANWRDVLVNQLTHWPRQKNEPLAAVRYEAYQPRPNKYVPHQGAAECARRAEGRAHV